jgi:hypothetical protein
MVEKSAGSRVLAAETNDSLRSQGRRQNSAYNPSKIIFMSAVPEKLLRVVLSNGQTLQSFVGDEAPLVSSMPPDPSVRLNIWKGRLQIAEMVGDEKWAGECRKIYAFLETSKDKTVVDYNFRRIWVLYEPQKENFLIVEQPEPNPRDIEEFQQKCREF